MKLIINTDSNAIIFALADDCETGFREPVGDEPSFFYFEQNGFTPIVSDLSDENTNIITVDSIPDDFAGCKYLYDTEQVDPFVLNPNWVDPDAE